MSEIHVYVELIKFPQSTLEITKQGTSIYLVYRDGARSHTIISIHLKNPIFAFNFYNHRVTMFEIYVCLKYDELCIEDIIQ